MRRSIAVITATLLAATLLAACSKDEPPIVINVPPPSPVSPVPDISSIPSPLTSISAIPVESPSESVAADLPLSEARVEGLFGGKGFANSRFRFAPRCSEGACPVFGKSGAIQMNFALNSRGVYSGKSTQNSTCSAGGVSTSTKVSYAIGFTVKSAEMIDGEWRATSLLTLTDIKRPYKKVTIGSKILTCKAYHKRSKGTSTLAAA